MFGGIYFEKESSEQIVSATSKDQHFRRIFAGGVWQERNDRYLGNN